MKRPRDFTKSVFVGFFLVVMLYMPLSIFGYVVYGAALESSVIYSVQTSFLQLGANLMIAVHCIMTLVIVINPLNQEVEHYLKISHGFGVGRVLTRTTVLLLVLFVALSVPDFSPVMNLVGDFTCVLRQLSDYQASPLVRATPGPTYYRLFQVGASTIPIGCAILPSLFYLYSEAATEDEWMKGHTPSLMSVIRRTDKTILIINFFILVVAIVGGVLGTIQGLDKIAKAEFSAPCYMRAFTSGYHNSSFTIKQNCCGRFRNISSYGDICGA
ncbi:hypothetical protein OESDEN_10381 [Oesophagostomum dentatum]|uniref:Amino acid transporter transmembrane domain-containing protein n=1 Tax=Oesophagostomum dentatum TaxID=61180 RepID=A0A0B1T310_OESDE|nr:hypothetical protein OESDEN_10381 [Oesophagostomum dentatum]